MNTPRITELRQKLRENYLEHRTLAGAYFKESNRLHSERYNLEIELEREWKENGYPDED